MLAEEPRRESEARVRLAQLRRRLDFLVITGSLVSWSEFAAQSGTIDSSPTSSSRTLLDLSIALSLALLPRFVSRGHLFNFTIIRAAQRVKTSMKSRRSARLRSLLS